MTRCFIAFVITLMTSGVGRAHSVGSAPVTLAFPGYISEELYRHRLASLKSYLEQRASFSVELRIARVEENFVALARSDAVAAAWFDPCSAVEELDALGGQPIVRGVAGIHSVVFARVDSAIRDAADLSGAVVAVGPRQHPLTLSLGLRALEEAGLANAARVVDIRPVGGHDDVALEVLHRRAAAGILYDRVFESLIPVLRNDLRVLARSEPLPGAILIANPKLDAAVRSELRRLLLDFHSAPGAATYFKSFKTRGWTDVTQADVDSARSSCAAAVPARTPAATTPPSG